MKKTYILIIAIAVILGITVALMPARNNRVELKPSEMLLSVMDESRFISVDDVTKLMINGDPSIVLIDVRSPEEFAKYSLPNAINIPLDSILSENYESVLNQKVTKNIFFSNGTIYANQAWMLTKRLNFSNNYIMEGGLNAWFETILMAKEPEQTQSQAEMDLYSFRIAAKQYFTGGGESASTTTTSAPVNVEIKKDKPKGGGGGC